MKPLRRDLIAMEWYSYDQIDQQKSQNEEEEDEYIDMEVNSFTHFISPHQSREFEFQMSLGNMERQSTTSPADELFYKGKLLPLHLPPRLQMVEKLIQDSSSMSHINKFNEIYTTPLGTNTTTTPTTNTPFESCNVSPVESCQVSRELNPDEYFRDFANRDDHQKGHEKSWTKKLKNKIKSLFGKSGCSNGQNERLDKQIKGTNKNTLGKISRRENEVKDGRIICRRRSFSGAFKRRSSTTKLSPSSSSGSSSSSSSSSSISNSNGLHDLQLLKRNSSSKSKTETCLIQEAIAHCKQSQHEFQAISEIGFHSLSSSSFADCDDQTRSTVLCRG